MDLDLTAVAAEEARMPRGSIDLPRGSMDVRGSLDVPGRLQAAHSKAAAAAAQPQVSSQLQAGLCMEQISVCPKNPPLDAVASLPAGSARCKLGRRYHAAPCLQVCSL